jgi:outer membrane protein assembly factor BamA
VDEYLRKNVTGYDGTAADAGTMTEKIAKALGDLLLLKGIKGRVEYSPSADPSGRNPSHLFAVRGATGLRVCSVSFPGAAAVKEQVLVQQSGLLVANEYSRQAALAFAETNLLPLYRERGNLRAAFRTPVARPAAEDDCLGVAVSLPVDEGVAYVWEKAEWSGLESLSAAALDAALGMRPRELVNVSKVEKGLEAARKLYARQGHLAAKLQPTFVFDDAARSVTYRVVVVEGPQYRMGELFITGLSEKDTNNVRTRWSLPPREVYDAEYLDGFLKKAVAEFLRDPSTDARALGKLKVDTNVRPDKEKLIVDVSIDFKQQK